MQINDRSTLLADAEIVLRIRQGHAQAYGMLDGHAEVLTKEKFEEMMK